MKDRPTCKNCGCYKFSEKETFGAMVKTRRWLVCDACDQILNEIKSEVKQ